MKVQDILRKMADNVDMGKNSMDGLLYDGKRCDEVVLICDSDRFTLAPKTHIVNGFEVPTPMSEKPYTGSIYYVPIPCNDDWVEGYTWYEDSCDNKQFVRGLCYTTKEAAVANAKAMAGINPYE